MGGWIDLTPSKLGVLKPQSKLRLICFFLQLFVLMKGEQAALLHSYEKLHTTTQKNQHGDYCFHK